MNASRAAMNAARFASRAGAGKPSNAASAS
jgi:hypothetical protein